LPAQSSPIEHLIDRIHHLLQGQPQGLSEHELLCRLRADDAPFMTKTTGHDTLRLFRQHFLIMHALYQLQARLERDGQSISIGPLNIRLRHHYRPRPGIPQRPDPLRAYYLDLTQLEGVDETEVNTLLADFWHRYQGFDQRGEALAELGLEDPVDARTIKQRYRRLAMEHHPDRGGDTATLQRLHRAMRILAP
jgi:DnaJ-domain-containing protein 1